LRTLNTFLELCGSAGPGRCAFPAGAGTRQRYDKLMRRLAKAPIRLADQTFTRASTVAAVSGALDGGIRRAVRGHRAERRRHLLGDRPSHYRIRAPGRPERPSQRGHRPDGGLAPSTRPLRSRPFSHCAGHLAKVA
jgi:hypothetical protein